MALIVVTYGMIGNGMVNLNARLRQVLVEDAANGQKSWVGKHVYANYAKRI